MGKISNSKEMIFIPAIAMIIWASHMIEKNNITIVNKGNSIDIKIKNIIAFRCFSQISCPKLNDISIFESCMLSPQANGYNHWKNFNMPDLT